MWSPNLIPACREIIYYTRPREVVGPYRSIVVKDHVGFYDVANPFGRYMRASTLRQKYSWRAKDIFDEKAELEAVTEVFKSLMVEIIIAFREVPALTDEELTKQFHKCAIEGCGIKRGIFKACQGLAESEYDLRDDVVLMAAMRDQVELGDQFDNPQWVSLILKKQRSEAKERREAQMMKPEEAEDARTKDGVLPIR